VRRVRTIRVLLALLLVPFALACKSECSKQSDCNTDGGESCLWPTGVGCGSTQGHCEKQNHCQSSAGPPTLLCTCNPPPTTLALECNPSNGITEQTTHGACAGGSGEAGAADDAGDGGEE
jgi:hypothetical protein